LRIGCQCLSLAASMYQFLLTRQSVDNNERRGINSIIASYNSSGSCSVLLNAAGGCSLSTEPNIQVDNYKKMQTDPLIFRDNATLSQWFESRSLDEHPNLSFSSEKRVQDMTIEEYKKTDSFEKEKDLGLSPALVEYFDNILGKMF
jgi:hypothetical protein